MSFSGEELDEFKAESLELLENAEKQLLSIDSGGDFRAAFDATFRCFHNLKGAAGMMDLENLQVHTHKLEELLMSFKEATSMPKPYVTLFLRGIDASRILIDGGVVDFSYDVEGDGAASTKPPATRDTQVPKAPAIRTPELSAEAIDEFLSECEEIVERVSANLQAMEAGGETGLAVKSRTDDIYRDIHSMKGSAFLYAYKKLGDLTHAMESSLEKIRHETHLPSKELLNALFRSLEIIDQYIQLVRSKTDRSTLDLLIPNMENVLNICAVNLPLNFSGTGSIAKPPVSAPIALQAPMTPQLATTSSMRDAELYETTKMSDENFSLPSTKDIHQPIVNKESEGATSVRVPISLLDNLMTLMGEMVLVRNQVIQFANKSDDLEFSSMSKRLNVVTSEIHEEMMKTRMQPIGNVLTKFNRVVRDLSQDLGKQINLHLHGTETELDKSLLEAIKDPLTHIVRNSCDHGIETPEARRKSGKTEVGNITIRAYHEGGQVIIEIQDDGKGLHRDAILQKALEKGLITQAEVPTLTEKQVFNLIFEAGFSTAAKITNVSGRGVGMDVVRTNIERIGGTVELASAAGSGTKTKIKIPLTLAIIPALIVNSGNGTYAIPQVRLEELVRVEQSSATHRVEIVHGVPVFRLRGNILPLVDLNAVLTRENRTDYRDGTLNIAVLNADQFSFGLIIDRIQDTADIVVKPLNRLIKSLQIYSGATVLGDGAVALILDIPGIAKVARLETAAARAIETSEDLAEKAKASSEVQDYLIVRLNSPTKHGIVLGFVHRLEEFRRSEIEYSGRLPVVRYRDVILPLISANEHLGYPPGDSSSTFVSVVVIKKKDALYGLMVDEIMDTLSTAADLDSKINAHSGIFGCLNTPQELIVVIDPFDVIERQYPNSKQQELYPAPSLASGPEAQPVDGQFPKIPATILLAEDTAFFRKAIKAVLEKTGYKVVCANDGQEAMDLLADPRNTFDLIVSDIEMPRLNGFQLAEAIRKHHTHGKLPMLAVSSRADIHSMEAGLKAGYDRYLEKLKPTILLSAVSELITKARKAA
ncbi:MAG: hybrid sensor histidine kinase/response regulator [Deltaproteobacteria bacterium]|nr:hybrid sensor histidine kinase/response regulator [Deltaproteobacteria bacterium]